MLRFIYLKTFMNHTSTYSFTGDIQYPCSRLKKLIHILYKNVVQRIHVFFTIPHQNIKVNYTFNQSN